MGASLHLYRELFKTKTTHLKKEVNLKKGAKLKRNEHKSSLSFNGGCESLYNKGVMYSGK